MYFPNTLWCPKCVCNVMFLSIHAFFALGISTPHCNPVFTVEINKGAQNRGEREGGGRDGGRKDGGRKEVGGRKEGRVGGRGGGRDRGREGRKVVGCSLPECKLDVLMGELLVIVQGEYGLCLDVGEGEEAIVETVTTCTNHL